MACGIDVAPLRGVPCSARLLADKLRMECHSHAAQSTHRHRGNSSLSIYNSSLSQQAWGDAIEMSSGRQQKGRVVCFL